MSKVLVADDDRQVRELLVKTLNDAGYDVVEAKDGKVAVEKVIQEHPDLVLLDIWMPMLDGFQVLEKLREDPDTQSLPVILLTALPAIQGEQAGINLGALHYITKPWLPGVIEAAIRVALHTPRASSGDEEDQENEDPEQWSHPVEYRDEPDEMEEEVEDDEHISTAGRLTPLENILGGGLSLGTLTMIEGATTAGKSIICQHLAYGALAARHGTAYYTSEHTSDSFGEQMSSIGLNVSDYVRDGHISIYPMQEPVQGEDNSPMLAALALEIEQTQEKCDFIIIDAITNLAGFSQEQGILAFFSALRRQCSLGRTIVVVAHSHAFSEDVFSRLTSLWDNHFKLRATKMRSKMVRMLEVAKAGGMELDRDNLVVFEVIKGKGAHIIPMSQVKA